MTPGPGTTITFVTVEVTVGVTVGSDVTVSVAVAVAVVVSVAVAVAVVVSVAVCVTVGVTVGEAVTVSVAVAVAVAVVVAVAVDVAVAVAVAVTVWVTVVVGLGGQHPRRASLSSAAAAVPGTSMNADSATALANPVALVAHAERLPTRRRRYLPVGLSWVIGYSLHRRCGAPSTMLGKTRADDFDRVH